MAKKRAVFEIVSPPAPPLLCATAGCPYDARVRVRVNKLWLNLCHACDDKRARADNLKWCLDRGLDTVEKQKAYCREILVKGHFKSHQFTKLREAAGRMREPGED